MKRIPLKQYIKKLVVDKKGEISTTSYKFSFVFSDQKSQLIKLAFQGYMIPRFLFIRYMNNSKWKR